MSMILEVQDVHAFYGKSHILQGVSLAIGEGETVTLLGRNGAGKSTTLKSIAGVVAPQRGTVKFKGADIGGWASHRIAAAGVCFVPEHRGVFRLLSVEENLKLGARRDSPWQLADIYRRTLRYARNLPIVTPSSSRALLSMKAITPRSPVTMRSRTVTSA
jgi:branched-chain amino acid transport system ATP-binding protein